MGHHANPNHLLHLSPAGWRALRLREGLGDDTDTGFNETVRIAERAVQRQVSHQSLTQEQFDALVSFTFNLGASGAMLVLRRVDAGDLAGAADVMLRISGPAQRRREESAPLRA